MTTRFDERKHRRARAGTAHGGRFISKEGGGDTAAEERAVMRALGVRDRAHVQASIRALQKWHGLKVDGIVGRQTALALRGKFGKARRTTAGAMSADEARALVRRHGTTGRRRRARWRGWTPEEEAVLGERRARTPHDELDAALRFRDQVAAVLEAARERGEPWVDVQGPPLRAMADRRVARAEAAVRPRPRRASRWQQFLDNDRAGGGARRTA